MVTRGAGLTFDIPNLPKLQRLLRESPLAANRGAYKGIRRGIAGFRKDWLRVVPVDIKGKGSKAPNNKRTGRNIGTSFIWAMKPKKESMVKEKTKVGGDLGTSSFAAHGLEIGGTVSPKKSEFMSIPITGDDALHRASNTKANGRVKPRWKTVERALSNKSWQFKLIDKGRSKVILTRKKMTKKALKDSSNRKKGSKDRRPWVPIFRLVRSITMKRGRLKFFSTWERLNPKTLDRFEQMIDAELKKTWAKRLK